MADETQQINEECEVTDRIFTVANVITFIRLLMIPASLAFLLYGRDVVAAVLFGITAATDFLDGQVARRTNTVSRLGRLLDPAVDRLLVVFAVIGLLIVGRLPLWVIVLVLARDILMLAGGAWLLKAHGIRVPVVYAGKVATTFLFVGMAFLMLNMPQVMGLGWCDVSWLPGFNAEFCSWGIWCIYIGLCLALFTTVYYVGSAYKMLKEKTQADGHGIR